MIFRKFVVLFWAFLLATAAIAGEEYRTKIEIAIDDDDSGHQSFAFDSKDAGFSLHDMEVGETRELTGESGNAALLTRTDDDNGVTIISGKSIDEATRERIREALQSAGQDGEVVFIDSNELMTGGGAHERHDVRIIRKEVDVTN